MKDKYCFRVLWDSNGSCVCDLDTLGHALIFATGLEMKGLKAVIQHVITRSVEEAEVVYTSRAPTEYKTALAEEADKAGL